MTENEQQLQRLLSEIHPLYEAPMREAKARQDALAKPPGSLGLLEEISIRLAGITGTVKNEASPTRIYVLAADNGVVSEGVSSAPQSVTRAQAINLTRGLTGASCLAKHFHDGLTVVDMGIALPYTCPEILDRSLGKGTANIAVGPAMPRPAAVQGILTGMELAAQARQDGIRLLGVGEMGIGNTTTSSAVLCALSGEPVEAVTGRGGRRGILQKKTGDRTGAGRQPAGRGRSDRRSVQGRRLRPVCDDGRLPRRGACAAARRGRRVHLDRRGPVRRAAVRKCPGLLLRLARVL